MTDGSPEQPELHVPQRLADDFARLYPPAPRVPQAVDDSIRTCAQAHFARQRRVRLVLGWAGVAGAAAAVILLAVRLGLGPDMAEPTHPMAAALPRKDQPAGTSPATPLREDVDHNGRVDILDAFALARDLERGAANNKTYDLDGDGRVGRSDVQTLAMSAVRLERGTLQ